MPLEGRQPVKLWPKTSSSGGSKAFGAVVVVMLSFLGSMSCSVVFTEASAWMLYGCLRVNASKRKAGGSRRNMAPEEPADEVSGGNAQWHSK